MPSFFINTHDDEGAAERKISFLTVYDDRFLVVDIAENLKITSMSGFDKRKKAKSKKGSGPRKFIEL